MAAQVLRYTGIPPSVLKWRPKLPSKNWLIFLGLTSSSVGLYVYDRRECRIIRQRYVDEVKHLADEPLSSLDRVRKVSVYCAKWPGDEDYERGVKYFKKYIKPILVAAAIDYDITAGERHGSLANIIADRIRLRRRRELGFDPEPPSVITLPGANDKQQQREREMAGGIIVVGRSTLKEVLYGLQKGWTAPLDAADEDEIVGIALQDDGAFDEPLEEDERLGNKANDDEHLSDDASSSHRPASATSLSSRSTFLPQHLRIPPPSPSDITGVPSHLNKPPAIIPAIPPLLLVPFHNYVGLKLIPLMILDFFTQRWKVVEGARSALALIADVRRPVDPLTDPCFEADIEHTYRRSTEKLQSEVEDARKSFYKSLPDRLRTARDLARGIREPTKAERNNPPPTEVDLRSERLRKEKRWRGDVAGWDIVRPGTEPVWDPRFTGALTIFSGSAQSADEGT